MRTSLVVMVVVGTLACSSNSPTVTDVDAASQGAVDATSGESEETEQADAPSTPDVGSDPEGVSDASEGIENPDAQEGVPPSRDASEAGPPSDAASSDAQEGGIQCAGNVCTPPDICCIIGLGADCRTQAACNMIVF